MRRTSSSQSKSNAKNKKTNSNAQAYIEHIIDHDNVNGNVHANTKKKRRIRLITSNAKTKKKKKRKKKKRESPKQQQNEREIRPRRTKRVQYNDEAIFQKQMNDNVVCLRDDYEDHWQHSLKVGDVIEFNYRYRYKHMFILRAFVHKNSQTKSSTYKHRLSTAMTKKENIGKKKRFKHGNTSLLDCPKWIPVQLTCIALSVTIEYAKAKKEDINKKSIIQTIRIGLGGSVHKKSRFPIPFTSPRIRAYGTKQNKKRDNYLKEGEMIQIFDETQQQWQQCKIIDIQRYIEFIYYSHCNELFFDSCYMDKINVRLPLQCVPRGTFSMKYSGKKIRIYWSANNEFYDAEILSVDIINKSLTLFYNDRYVEEVSFNSTLYFPITKLSDIPSWVYLRPTCGFCGSYLQERVATKCKYQNNVCWKCDHEFRVRDSIWICPFEKRVKFHPRKYFLDSVCISSQNDSATNQIKTPKNVSFDKVNINQKKCPKSRIIESMNTNLVKGHKNAITNMAELYRMPIGAPLPHLQLIDAEEQKDENKPILINKEMVEENKYLEQYLSKLYHSVLYLPYSDHEFFVLCKKYLHTNFVPKRNRKTPLHGEDVIISAKYSFPSQLQKVIQIFVNNNNKHSLFYILKAVELRYFYVCNALHGRPKTKSLGDDILMHYEWRMNMKHALIPPILNMANHQIINDIAENHNIRLTQPQFIRYTNNPILSGQIGASANNSNFISSEMMEFEQEAKEVDNLMSDTQIEPGRMSAFCVPQFDICIMVRRDSNLKQSTMSSEDASSYQLYKTAEAIVVSRDDSNVSPDEHAWRSRREPSTINPWTRGDKCLIFVDQTSIWMQAKVVKIYETECKVDIYSNELRWPKHRTYGALSQFIMPNVRNAKDMNVADMPLLDRLHHGTIVKLWAPPWRKGRVLWKWNENDLVCIQLKGQRLEYAQTYHVNDEKWKMEVLENESIDAKDIAPPLQFIMAKKKYLALSNEIINSGLLVVSSGSDSDSAHEIEENEEGKNEQNEDTIQVIDLSSNENCQSMNRKKQKLNKVKIINMKKSAFKKISSSKKKKKKKSKVKKKEGIEVVGINEGDIFYPDDVVNISWTLNRCVIYDDEDENGGEQRGEKSFNIYLESTNWTLGMDGKPQPEIDQILLASHVALKENANGQYCYSVMLPISFLKYDYEENEDSDCLQQAACCIRVVFVNNEYYFYRLNGTSETFELRNKIKKQFQTEQEQQQNDQMAIDIEHNDQSKEEDDNENEIEIENDNEENKEIEFVDDTELNANEQIGKDDNGAWCICGAVQENIDEAVEEQKDKIVEWIQCDYCFCWQHLKCLDIGKVSVDDKYKCVWCLDEYDENEQEHLKKYFEDSKAIKILKFVKNLFSASKYRGKRYGFWYGKKRKFDDEKYDNLSELKNLCIAHGVDSTSNDADTLKSNLTYASKFARTPLTLSNFMCSLFGINEPKEEDEDDDNCLNCVDLMAGNGNIARFIAKHHNILAVERRITRLESGKHLVSNADWKLADVFSQEFIEQYVCDKAYDVVYCNPDLNNVIPAIYIGLQMIKRSKYAKKCLIYLLPIDVFESNSFQCRLFRVLGCHIYKLYQVGRWNYYGTDKSHPKSVCDGVWIIKPGRKSMDYEFRCYDVRTNLKLSTKALET